MPRDLTALHKFPWQ